ncbi:UNVERIFIED_CONTAM: hypothetical protein Sradi_7207500 [Sesamum radiatum]|uniref:Uncharacterized protein n=1 Tax=Sesamum radiatum TaxID=300843 RepID=A0AAW2IQ66_SESRA
MLAEDDVGVSDRGPISSPCILLRDECRHLECSRSQPSRPSGGGEGASSRIQVTIPRTFRN